MLLASPRCAQGALHDYKDVVLPRNMLLYRKSGMYGPNDAPAGEGNPSFIKLHLRFERVANDYPGQTVSMQVAVFDEDTWETKLGAFVKTAEGGEERVYCCTAELKKAGVCDAEAQLILREDPEQGTYVYDVVFEPDADNSKTLGLLLTERAPIKSKGVKYVLFSACNDLVGQVTINGQTEVRARPRDARRADSRARSGATRTGTSPASCTGCCPSSPRWRCCTCAWRWCGAWPRSATGAS